MKIGIKDIQQLVTAIKVITGHDISVFSTLFLIRRTRKLMEAYSISDVVEFINKCEYEPRLPQLFIQSLYVESSEMFRDPPLWTWLRDVYLKMHVVSDRPFKIFLPMCVSGKELFSLCIMLQESGASEQVQVVASTAYDACLNRILQGVSDDAFRKSEHINYNRYNASGDYKKYFISQYTTTKLDAGLLSRVTFIHCDPVREVLFETADLILFRNRMLYFTVEAQNVIIANLYKGLTPEGLLIIGNKEDLDMHMQNSSFNIVHAEEKVFKKQLV